MFTPESYTIVAHLFPRLLGFIYFFAFGAFLFQIRGLLGQDGILPVSEYLEIIKKRYPKNYYRIIPSVFWINSSDKSLMGVTLLGTICAVLLMAGIAPPFMLVLLYVLYLSIVSTGQDFLSFGWEGFLLEITVNTFLLSLTSVPNLMVWMSINFLLFRFHFQAGAVKLQSQDPHWKNLTAIGYHYLSQPIPNVVAWYAHKLPMWFHKICTVLMFIVELAVPFGIFGPDIVRLWCFFALAGLQVVIWATGNLSFLNHLTFVFATILIANQYLTGWFSTPSIEASNPAIDMFCWVCGTLLFTFQAMQLWQHFAPNHLFRQWLNKFSPFHIINRYGIFAVMTTNRFEIIFEGSDDGETWKEYTFKHKPSEVTRRPTRISPYQPRIDWQAWFLPLGDYKYDPWFESFLVQLLKGNKTVLKLLRYNPFPDHPPKYIRTVVYDYEFSSFEEKKKLGIWWKRTYMGEFTHPIMLNDSDFLD